MEILSSISNSSALVILYISVIYVFFTQIYPTHFFYSH